MNLAQMLKSKKFVIRAILVAAYILVGILMVYSGKRHTILIDNKDAEDGSYQAIDGMSVQIDNLEAAEYYAGDRDKAVVKGQKHVIRIELFDEEKKIEKSFTVPFGNEMLILSVPKLVNNIEPFIEPFTALMEQNSQTEPQTPDQQHFGSDLSGEQIDMTAENAQQ